MDGKDMVTLVIIFIIFGAVAVVALLPQTVRCFLIYIHWGLH